MLGFTSQEYKIVMSGIYLALFFTVQKIIKSREREIQKEV